MSAKRKATPADLKERSAATHWAENHPLRGLARQHLFLTLARLVDKERTVYAGARFLAWRMGSNTVTVTKFMGEFRKRGLVDFLGKGGLGGENRYRLNYDQSVALYPDSLTVEQFKASNAATQFEDDEALNGVEQFEQERSVDKRESTAPKCVADSPEVLNVGGTKCVTDQGEVLNGTGRSVKRHYTKDIKDRNEQQGNQQEANLLEDVHRLSARLHGQPGLVDFAARSSTDVCPTIGANGVAQNPVMMVLTHPVIRDLDEVLRLRADDLLQVLARDHALPLNNTAVKRVACALAELANARCTTEQMRTAIYRVRGRGDGTYSKVLAEARQALRLRVGEDDTDDIPFAPEPSGRLQ